MIGIVDYGAGNLKSVTNAFRALGQEPIITHDAERLRQAEAIVLPGVGAFGDGMEWLRRVDLIDPLTDIVVRGRRPFLGICLGLQFLAERSVEHGDHEGLGWLKGSVQRIEPDDPECRVPHIGWNDLTVHGDPALFRGIDRDLAVYFVHSYHFVPASGDENVVTATTDHGANLVAAVAKDNIHAVQFHPEKSQRDGLALLQNFLACMKEVPAC